MSLDQILSRIEAGESVHQACPKERTDGLGAAYFARLIPYYGADNARLSALGQHWKAMIPRVADPAWVYRAGGIFARIRGDWESSAEAFLLAGNHSTDRIARYSFQVGAIDSLARAGRIDEASALAAKLAKNLRRLGEPTLAARALLNLGNALVYQDRMVEGRKVLLKALPALDAGGLLTEAASARLALSSTHLFGGDPRVAERIALEVIDSARKLDATYLVCLAQLNLALCMVVTSRPEEAHRILLELQPQFDDSPFDELRVKEYLADALFRLNLWSESEIAYREVLAAEVSLPRLHEANNELGLGQALLAQGNAVGASAHFKRALKAYVSINNKPWQAACLHQLAVAQIDSGNLKMAKKRLLEAESLALHSPFHLAQIYLTLSRLGEDRLVEARRLITRFGFLEFQWQVHHIQALRSKSPQGAYRNMLQAMVAGRIATRSFSGRMAFLKDKTNALRDYLGWLLENPTQGRVAEAISVIQQVRSVTLLDEIMHSGALPDRAIQNLERVRAELESAMDEGPKGGTRKLTYSKISVSQAQRSATHALMDLEFEDPVHAGSVSPGVVLADTPSGIRILSNGRSEPTPIEESRILDALRWLPYELVAPMSDPAADPGAVNSLLHTLARAFEPVWKTDGDRICPDGYGWTIPWSLCSHYAGKPKVWEIALHPKMNACFNQVVTRRSKAVVWLGRAEDLRFATQEAENIAAQFDNCKIATTQAEARATLEGSYDILHVVSHAIHRPENPMLSSIQFPDGAVHGYEIARSNLRVGLATLSACETGSLSLATKSEPDGLARAFMARGSESVIASQWPLDDEAAHLLFCAFYQALLTGNDLKSSISHAQCICRDWHAHPYYWGALALYSGYKA